MKTNPFKSRGLTLLELMITLAIAGILIASAAPSFRASIQNTRMVTQVNELQAALSLARSEAIKRNENVTVCQSNDGASCAGNWQDGWIVFVDRNFNGSVNGDGDAIDCEANEDCVLRVHGGLSNGDTLAFSQTNVIYATNGIARTGVNGVFTLCDSRGADKAKGLVIGVSGRPRLAISSDNLGCSS